jgi:hypothetical protein
MNNEHVHFKDDNEMVSGTYCDGLTVLVFLLCDDGRYCEDILQHDLHIDIGYVLHLNLCTWLEDLVQMVRQLFVDVFDKLQEVLDLKRKCNQHFGLQKSSTMEILISILICKGRLGVTVMAVTLFSVSGWPILSG